MRQQIVLNPINYNHRPGSLPTALGGERDSQTSGPNSQKGPSLT
jgi:hypothetical protein